MKLDDFFEINLSSKEWAYVNTSFNNVKQERKKYIIYPPSFERKYGFRVRKWDEKTCLYKVIPIKQMSGEELEMVRNLDFKVFGKVFV